MAIDYSDAKWNKKDENPSIHFNTGSVYDLLSGKLVKGYDGKYYINGGISNLNYLFQGVTNSYKSTIMDSLLSYLLVIYKDMHAFAFDTENHKLDTDRFNMIAGEDISSRVHLQPKMPISEVLEWMINMWTERKKNKKDLLVETPFLDMDGKRITTFAILPCEIDSLSKLDSPAELETLTKHDLEDSKMNMIFMNDGKRKTILTRAMPTFCKEAGLAFLCSAHSGEKNDLGANPMSKPKKEMQFMKAGQVIKGVGSNAKYLSQVTLETSSKLFTTSDGKEPLYQVPFEPATNLNKVTMQFQKGKNNVAGGIFEFAVTQTHGILSGLTNVHFSKEHDAKGFNKSGVGGSTYSTCFLPDKKSTRKNIRTHLQESYELRRAYDLIMQIQLISMTYDRDTVPVPIDNIDLNKACEKLIANNSTVISDIVNSRGYWTYLPDDRPYMSVYDVLDILHKEQ